MLAAATVFGPCGGPKAFTSVSIFNRCVEKLARRAGTLHPEDLLAAALPILMLYIYICVCVFEIMYDVYCEQVLQLAGWWWCSGVVVVGRCDYIYIVYIIDTLGAVVWTCDLCVCACVTGWDIHHF